MKNFLVIVGITILILIVTQLFTPADAQIGLVESRLARVESELVGIQSQLNQLSVPRGGVSVPSPFSVSRTPVRSAKYTDAEFDRLATLVIESRDRIQALEEKVAKLEKR